MSFYLGKYVYLMDAYEDIEKDKKRQEYNPLSKMVCEKEGDFETFAGYLQGKGDDCNSDHTQLCNCANGGPCH